MAETMTASQQPMTDGQIDNLVDKFRAAVRKHRSEFGSEAVQQVLGVENLGTELLVLFRKHVEAVSSMIVRHVKVDRTRSPQEVLDATGRKQYTDRDVVKTMPRGEGEGEEVDVYFFNLDYDPTPAELDREYELRQLKADPIAQAQVNTDDPAFADDRPNNCQWGLENGVASFAVFDRWVGERDVNVLRYDGRWYRRCRFGGVRK